MQTSSLAMSWHRKLHEAPDSPPNYDSPPAPPPPVPSPNSPAPSTAPPPTPPTATPSAPPTSTPSSPLMAQPPAKPPTAPSFNGHLKATTPSVGLIISPPAPPTEPPMAPPTTARSYPLLYGESPSSQSPSPTFESPPSPPASPPAPTQAPTPASPPAPMPAPTPASPQEPLPAPTPASPPGPTLASLPEPPPPSLPALTPAPSFNGNRGKTQVGLIVGTVIGGLILLVAVGIFFIWYRRRNRRRRRNQRRPDEGPATNDKRQLVSQSPISNGSSPQMLQLSVARGPSSSSSAVHRSLYLFSYEDLAKATDSFSKTNFRGEGGYGTVHEGVLPDGKRVAIKQLRLYSNQGEKEFIAEVEIISRVHHKNLVSLVGYCISEEHKILVYEFVPNGTLHFHLHGKVEPTIDWPTRMKIALGIANGLAYLHEECLPQIIHRDIKTANILLHDKFEVKVADFGLAKFSSDTRSYVSTGVKGTWGYLDPAYLTSEKLTDKVDIFSFGVVLLELITGLLPKRESELLFQWAKPVVKQVLENGNFHAIIDPRLQNEYINPSEMRRMLACAAACVHDSASNRPKMSQIVRALEGNLSLEDLNGGIKLGDSGEFGSYGSKSYDTNQRNEDLKKYNKLFKEDTNEQSEPSINYVSALQTAR